jgi:hypothetical protein
MTAGLAEVGAEDGAEDGAEGDPEGGALLPPPWAPPPGAAALLALAQPLVARATALTAIAAAATHRR